MDFVVTPPSSAPPDPTEFIKPTTHEPILDYLTRGLPEIQRSKVIAAWSRLEDAESSFPGTLAIVLASSATFTAREIKNAVGILQDLPANLAHASTSLNVVVADQSKALDELRTTIDEVKSSATGVIDAQRELEEREKKRTWRDKVVYAGMALTLVISGIFAFIGLNSGNGASALMAKQEVTQEVLELSWERAIILAEKSNLRSEDAGLRRKAVTQQLSAEEMKDLANLEKLWFQLLDAEEALRDRENQLKGKMRNLNR